MWFGRDVIMCKLNWLLRESQTPGYDITPAIAYRKESVLVPCNPEENSGCAANSLRRRNLRNFLMALVKETSKLLLTLQETWTLMGINKGYPPPCACLSHNSAGLLASIVPAHAIRNESEAPIVDRKTPSTILVRRAYFALAANRIMFDHCL
jgi:hypothetical protein